MLVTVGVITEIQGILIGPRDIRSAFISSAELAGEREHTTDLFLVVLRVELHAFEVLVRECRRFPVND